jgi:hypothetical protein
MQVALRIPVWGDEPAQQKSPADPEGQSELFTLRILSV